MPFRCLLRIRFAEKFLKGACARQDENHKSSIGSCEWDFCHKENFSLAELPLRAKKYGAGGYDPGFSGLSVFYGLSILPAPFRCLAGLPAASQASGGSHLRSTAASQTSGGSHLRSPAASDDQAISVTL